MRGMKDLVRANGEPRAAMSKHGCGGFSIQRLAQLVLDAIEEVTSRSA
jgi:hypothetical protein